MQNPIRAAILAGGLGTRMGGLFSDIPKPMIPVAGKPVLQHQIEALAEQGIHDITLITGHKTGAIRVRFGDGTAFGVRISYIVEDEPLGTGGALSLLPREHTLVLLGDLYLNMDFGRFVRFHRENGAGVSLFAHPNSHPHDSDIVVADEQGRVREWVSKKRPPGGDYRNLVNAGVYLFSADCLPCGAGIRRDLDRDIVVPLIPGGRVFAYRSAEYVKDMGTPERLEAVERDIARGVPGARCLSVQQRAVFIDRDGVIIEEDGYIRNTEQVRLLPGAAGSIRRLNASGFLAICVTNQPVIARGELTPEGLEAVHARMDTLLGAEGAYLDDLLYCPHHPDKGFPGEAVEYKMDCECRKPKPGMILEAARRYNIDLPRSYMIGDRTADIAAGKAAGCRALGVRTGDALRDGKYDVPPDGVYDTLSEAVESVLSEETK